MISNLKAVAVSIPSACVLFWAAKQLLKLFDPTLPPGHFIALLELTAVSMICAPILVREIIETAPTMLGLKKVPPPSSWHRAKDLIYIIVAIGSSMALYIAMHFVMKSAGLT